MNAYIRNRQNRPEFSEDREKFGTKFLDTIGDRINKTGFGKARQKALQKQQDIQQKLSDDSSPLEKSLLFPQQNKTEAKINAYISDVTQIDQRISEPLTYAAIGGAAKGLSIIASSFNKACLIFSLVVTLGGNLGLG